jgi:hypothetical protein
LLELINSISNNNVAILNQINKLKFNIFISQLSGTKSLLISHSIKRELVKNDTVIFYEGAESDKLYIVASGKFKVTSK